MRKNLSKKIGALFIIIVILLQFLAIYTDWIWFSSVNYGSIFTRTLMMRVLSGLFFGSIVFIILFINLSFAKKLLAKNTKIYELDEDNIEFLNQNYSVTDYISDFVRSKYAGLIIFIASLIIGILSGISASLNWMDFAKFFNATSFGLADPLFGNDVSYYVFRLPFLTQLYSTVFGITLLTIIAVAALYYMVGFLQKISSDPTASKTFSSAISHISILGAITLFIRALGYKLDIDQLVFSPRGVAFGASYTDIYAQRPVLFISLAIAAVGIILFLVNIKLKKPRILVIVPVVLLVVNILGGSIYPAIIQQIIVTPNELQRESEFIEYNIDFTRKSYGLDSISEEPYPADATLTLEDIEANSETIKNIRLHDMRPALDTYNQIEAIRPYYDFLDVDIDRYVIDGELTQVMLSARELVPDKLDASAQSWINLHLKYTHGQGAIVSPVNKVSSQGLPTFIVNQIPPRSTVDKFQIHKPQIYFGEQRNLHYIITRTAAPEIDYTSPAGPVEYFYTGDDGIQMTFMNKALYSIRLGTLRLFLNQDINNESTLMIHRNIRERVNTIAPFLLYDEDPYLVIHDNHMYWMIDAYTYTGNYPYAEPYERGLNYIRNSVKVVIDAYHGTVDFYLFDESDPIAQTYASIFPSMFKSVENMPENLRNHVRYPETMFKIQSEMLLHYHMKDVRNFFYKDDAWSIANEIYGQAGGQVQVEPRYILMALPGEEKAEFVMMLPFTPLGRNNMISWLAARMDGDNYGEIILYQFPRQEFVNGPLNIENRIDQNTDISGQLSLWSQQGSGVIRGNLMVIPVADAILFVEPIYLRASSQGLPEIRRIVVAYGDRIVMAETFESALIGIFGEAEDRPDDYDEFATLIELTQRAQRLYTESDEAIKNGDWATYGELQEELGTVIDRIVEIANIPLDSIPDSITSDIIE